MGYIGDNQFEEAYRTGDRTMQENTYHQGFKLSQRNSLMKLTMILFMQLYLHQLIVFKLESLFSVMLRLMMVS